MRNSRGFTLLEIIIAISLIAIFITLPVLAYSNYLKKTRDTQRKSSINQIQSALEQYRANNGKYPATDIWKDALVTQGYLPTIPKDPLDGQAVTGETGVVYKFDYSADADGQNYQLTSRLEENQPGGKGYSNEKSTYVVTPIGPMIRYTTPMVMGSGSSTIASGTLNGAFSGTGTGTVNSGTVTFQGTMSGNTFTGSFTGNAAGSGVSGTISGNYSGTATGNATGSVGGSATITGGTANSVAHTLTGGSFSNLTLTPLSGPGVSRITDGNLTASFAGSGSGAVTGGSVTYTGTISGNTFTGTASGNVTGSATGTISGPVNLATTGSLEGTVSGTTGILSGNVSNSSFLGTADIANLVLTGNGLPSSAPIPTSTNYPTRIITATYTPTPTPTPIRWTRSIGGTSQVAISGGKRTSDGGVVVAGTVDPLTAGSEAYVFKFNSLGIKSWSTKFGTTVPGYNIQDTLSGIEQTADGGYIAVGYTSNDTTLLNKILVTKLASNGTITWTKEISGTTGAGWLRNGVRQTADLGYIIGSSNLDASGKYDGYLVKLDSAGAYVWAKTYGTAAGTERFTDVVQAQDGGYVAAGTNSLNYIYLVRTDSTGNIVWQKQYGSTTSTQLNKIIATADGSFVVAGTANSKGYIAKIASDGTLTWDLTYYKSSQANTYDVSQTSDGGYVFTGSMVNSPLLNPSMVGKINSSGSVVWQKVYSSAYILNFISENPGNGFYTGGYITSGSTAQVLRIDTSGNINCNASAATATFSTIGYSAVATGTAASMANAVSVPTISQASYAGEAIGNICN